MTPEMHSFFSLDENFNKLLEVFDFLKWLRSDMHGRGEYQLLIRRGRKMIFSGYIGLE
jgi:hypothetical protein